MLSDEVRKAIRSLCQRTLMANWREGVYNRDGTPFAYTCPSPGHYPWQWYWDSCFHAIVWRRFAPERSRRELESLLASQYPDGFIGHTIFWNTPLFGVRKHTYNVVSAQARTTASIQPPALAWAWQIAVGDPRLEPRIAAHHDWLERHRDLEGDGLLWIVQPDESGLDASTMFDAVWGWHAHDLPGYVPLVRRNRRFKYDMKRIAAAGGPVVCEVATNVLYGLSRLAIGRPSITPALIARCYNERTGLFDLQALPTPRRRPATTWAALSPLALPDLPEPIGRRLVEEHLLDEKQFWLPVPPPSVAADDPRFSTGDGRFGPRRYWRGPTWINSAWMLWLGLARLGYTEQADELATRIGATVHNSGLREYYQPYTGAGMGATHFGWSSLVLEMIEPDPRAPASYLNQLAEFPGRSPGDH